MESSRPLLTVAGDAVRPYGSLESKLASPDASLSQMSNGPRSELPLVYDPNFGVAFSGGGVRSAAFCSGVLRRLLYETRTGRGEMPKYLSCVSGGGYIGAGFVNSVYAHKKRGEVFSEAAYFRHVKENIGYYLNWKSSLGGCRDLLKFSVYTCILLLTSIAVLLPPTYLMTEFFSGVLPLSMGIVSFLQVYFLYGPFWLFLLATFVSTCWPDGIASRFLNNANWYLSSLMALFVFSILGDFSEPDTSQQYAIRILLMIMLALYNPGYIPMFLQAQVVLWAMPLDVARTHTIFWHADSNFEEHYRYFVIVSRCLMPFIGCLAYWRDKMVFDYSKARLKTCFFPDQDQVEMKEQSVKGTDLPVYIGQCTVNKWVIPKRHDVPGYEGRSYGILAMGPEGWERYEYGLRKPIKISHAETGSPVDAGVEAEQCTEDLKGARVFQLSQVCAMSAAAASFFNGDFRGLRGDNLKLQVVFGLHMGRWEEMAHAQAKWKALLCILVDGLLGLPIIIAGQLTDPVCRTGYQHESLASRCEGTEYDPKTFLSGALSVCLFLVYVALLPCLDFSTKEPKQCSESNPVTKPDSPTLPARRSWRSICRSVYPLFPHARVLSSLTNAIDTSGTLPPMLYFSDGGHVDNSGLIPLIQRKLKRIIVVNGGEDPQGTDFKKALKEARERLGVTFGTIKDRQSVLEAIDAFMHSTDYVLELKIFYVDEKIHTWWHHAEHAPEGTQAFQDQKNPDKEQLKGRLYFIKPSSTHHEDTDAGYKEQKLRGKIKGYRLCCSFGQLSPVGKQSRNFPRARRHLAGCCCTCCHRCDCWYLCSGRFPYHHTAFQFMTGHQYDSYHSQGIFAMRELSKFIARRVSGSESSGVSESSGSSGGGGGGNSGGAHGTSRGGGSGRRKKTN